jgi:hypothetical protein
MAKKSREEIDHYVLDQWEQERHLGIGHERTKNLGHDWRESEIEKNPAGRVMNYDTAPQAEKQIAEGQRDTTGVYQKHVPINDGRSTAENLQAWSKYSTSNSFHGRDPRGRGEGSDNHLLSTKGWANLPDAGSESGQGRLEKIHSRK